MAYFRPDYDWRETVPFTNEQQRFFNRVLLASILIGFGIWLGNVLFESDKSYWVNLYTDALSIGIAVGIIDALNERRARKQLRQQLIREMSSRDNSTALRALVEINAHGWLRDGSLRRAYMGGANLEKAFLSGASLEEIDCDTSIWRNALLSGANLRNARLEWADLEGVSLVNADLRGTYFIDAHLKGARLKGAKLDETTIMPDGSHWTEKADLGRFTNPNHPQFWQPKWIKNRKP